MECGDTTADERRGFIIRGTSISEFGKKRASKQSHAYQLEFDLDGLFAPVYTGRHRRALELLKGGQW